MAIPLSFNTAPIPPLSGNTQKKLMITEILVGLAFLALLFNPTLVLDFFLIFIFTNFEIVPTLIVIFIVAIFIFTKR
jgi:hypothetical protein